MLEEKLTAGQAQEISGVSSKPIGQTLDDYLWSLDKSEIIQFDKIGMIQTEARLAAELGDLTSGVIGLVQR